MFIPARLLFPEAPAEYLYEASKVLAPTLEVALVRGSPRAWLESSTIDILEPSSVPPNDGDDVACCGGNLACLEKAISRFSTSYL